MSSRPAERPSLVTSGAKVLLAQRPSEISPESDAEAREDADFTAASQLAYLEAAVTEWHSPAQLRTPTPNREPETKVPEAPPTTAPVRGGRRPLMSITTLKSLVAIAIAVALGWMPVQRLLATTSAEAVVNARIITIRAPIEGEVSLAHDGTDIGSPLQTDQTILTIRNPRADTAQLANLMRERDQLRTNVAALAAKSKLLKSSLIELDAQQERFRLGRIQQIEQRVREADADIASAQAQYSVAFEAQKRASSLRRTDAVSQAFLDKAEGDERVTKQAILAQIERKKGILVELDAAKKGTFVGDSYNDTPQSAQRKMEVSIELSDAEARLAGNRTELAAIDTAIATAQTRQNELSLADIRSTVNGRVWEMLTAPGEHVNAGQNLMKVLDCGSAIVTASVSETTYERLAIGQSATFTPRDGGAIVKGIVVGLNGLAAVESNTAIQQSALSREPYHVSLKFPELSNAFDCRVGRSGIVKFGDGGSVFAGSIY
ncbi:HlyD family secretion protein [Hyphomicrobium sp.]|jgi:multidrug resistance efflux pump|uniref:HlyD family secretion protein n=1 Tax=Hyphomicrobium sp. TaxID=82 RepID=UPI00356AA6F6